ncbi:MAG: DUF2156 domain-containing protein [Ruminococcaceae bacterium]|nr:DUF2156 domain-containing protein [Oscillospiraceae bacterium]
MTEITLENRGIINSYLANNGEFSCENSFVNLLVWQKSYHNCYKIYDDCFLLYSKSNGKKLYRLPLCDDFIKGFKNIIEHNDGKLPFIWAQDGERFETFKKLYGDKYDFFEIRDAFDYIYNSKDLAELSGKKYHSKRNHISAFSKKYDWQYKTITNELKDKVLACADKWYKENEDRLDKYMLVEREGISTIINNMDLLDAKGGAIIVNDEVVAFTLGSPINDFVFDVHIEKALSKYSEAYTVINREFVKNELFEYKYINREDDMGLMGLRKAKLSYKPEILLKKYRCVPKGEADEEY